MSKHLADHLDIARLFERIKNESQHIALVFACAAVTVEMAHVLGGFAKAVRWTDGIIIAVTVALSAAAGIYSMYISRILKRASHKKRVFISYSHDKKDKARELRGLLLKQGAVVWLDENILRPGDDLDAAINSAIESSNAVVAIVSATIGEHTKKELKAATEKNVPVFMVTDNQTPTKQSLLDGIGSVVVVNTQNLAQAMAGALREQ